jgi:hypothetical protein
VIVMGIALLVATPRYGWYAALLIALIVMSGRIEWLPVGFASSFAYLGHGTPSDESIFAIAGALTFAGVLVSHHDHIAGRVRRISDSRTRHIATAQLQRQHR